MHSEQVHKNNIISSECQRGQGLRAMGLRSGNKGKDAFVVVSYDFEYITEEGKEVIFLPTFQPVVWLFSSHLAQVWMKEGEVLLLLSKTNGDWWQVC